MEINQNILSSFCKLATIIECPGFLCTYQHYSVLRIQMLDRECHPYLLKTLCAILMILPQGKIAHMLKNRVEISKMVGKGSSKPVMREGLEE